MLGPGGRSPDPYACPVSLNNMAATRISILWYHTNGLPEAPWPRFINELNEPNGEFTAPDLPDAMQLAPDPPECGLGKPLDGLVGLVGNNNGLGVVPDQN